jgi:hypothetical protein
MDLIYSPVENQNSSGFKLHEQLHIVIVIIAFNFPNFAVKGYSITYIFSFEMKWKCAASNLLIFRHADVAFSIIAVYLLHKDRFL